MNLYETGAEIDRVWEAIEAAEAEGKEPGAELIERMRDLQLEFDKQMEWCYATIKNNEAWAAANKAEAEAYALKAKHYTNRVKATKALVEFVLEGAAWKSQDAKRGFVFQKNPPSVEYTDRAAVPDDYCTFERVEQTAEILTALKAGRVVPGATLVTDKKHLRVK